MHHILQLRILDPRFGADWPLPEYATKASAGLDLRAALDKALTLHQRCRAGAVGRIAVHLGDPTMCAVILPRSGLEHRHGIVLGNGTGLIDADYQGPLLISVWNRGREALRCNPGPHRQLGNLPIVRATSRGGGTRSQPRGCESGFGHTGVR